MHSSGKTNARRRFHSLAAKRQLYLRFWGVMASFARFLARKNITDYRQIISPDYFRRVARSNPIFLLPKQKNSRALIIRYFGRDAISEALFKNDQIVLTCLPAFPYLFENVKH